MAQTLRLCLLACLAAASLPVAAMNDPMAPPVRPAAGSATPAPGFSPAPLQWTRVGGASPLAWYAGRPVAIGDAVEGGRIAAIADDHIVIAAHGRLHRVFLVPHDWRQPVEGTTTAEGRRTGGKHVERATPRKPNADRADLASR